MNTITTPTILLVDDEPRNLDVLHHSLRKSGFKVLVAINGEEALIRVSRTRPDLILLDVNLPGIDGFETCRRIHAMDAGKDVPIIFITMDTDVVDKVKGLEIGAVDYITKPFQPEEVVARIDRHLTIRNLQQQLEEQNAQLQQEIAERKQAEKNYKSLFEAIPDDAFVLDWDWRYVVVNKSSWEHTAFTKDDIIGKKITDVYPQMTTSPFWPAYQKAMLERLPGREEAEFVFETGEKGWYELRIFPVPGGILVISRDMTERKQAEEALRKSEYELSTIFHSTPTPMLVLDKERRVRKTNRAASVFSRKSEADMQGSGCGNALNCIHVHDHPQGCGFGPNCPECLVRRSALETMKTGIAHSAVETFFTAVQDGKEHQLCMLISTDRIEIDDEHMALVNIQDITERKQAEAALQEAHNMLLIAEKTAKAGSWKWELKTNKVTWSENMCRLHGIEPEDFDSTFETAMKFIHSDDVNDVTDNVQKMLSEKHEALFEYRILTATNTLKFVQGMNQLFFDKDGNIVEVMGMVQDITERKQAEIIQDAQLRLIEYAVNHSIRDYIRKFLDEAEALTGSTIGFYHFVEDDQETLSLQTWSTNTLQNMCTAEGEGQHYPISEAGVWVDCIHERKAMVHNDYATLPHKKGLPEGHAPIIRELVAPVIRGGKIVAILGVGNKKNDYVEHDVRLVQQLADNGWESIIRKRAEEALQESLKKYETLFGTFPWVSLSQIMWVRLSKPIQWRKRFWAFPKKHKNSGLLTASNGNLSTSMELPCSPKNTPVSGRWKRTGSFRMSKWGSYKAPAKSPGLTSLPPQFLLKNMAWSSRISTSPRASRPKTASKPLCGKKRCCWRKFITASKTICKLYPACSISRPFIRTTNRFSTSCATASAASTRWR